MSADNHVPRHQAAAPVDDDTGYAPAQYLGPVDGSSTEGRHQRRYAAVPPDASYATQLLVWREGGRRRVVRTTAGAEVESAHPWGGAVLILSAWNPRGEARTLQENTDDQVRLADRVADRGGSVRGRVVAVPPGRGWAEEALVVAGLDRGEGLALAREFGQLALLDWGLARLTVVPAGGGGMVAPSSRPWWLTDAPLTCPMRLDERAGAKCTVHGGPWTSGSIHAAGVWQAHRDLLTSLLGCDVCADGTLPVNGPGGGRGAISIDPVKLASRYGGYVW